MAPETYLRERVHKTVDRLCCLSTDLDEAGSERERNDVLLRLHLDALQLASDTNQLIP